ncbi:Ubiquinol cytochrome-c reductase assembly protein Cbp3 [Coemansia javaensis]|uniref:Ubiquinol cytochrome-c reductase assembly protein Cbp3 n=1 Tax=Coemansia javaensis TaxID=2761396 RepID=A0A9W8H6J4_9FUNG|nr:Ubiquinol cytochrome-c reductase assembly protein Cbp3 [Coemansia javaensis]
MIGVRGLGWAAAHSAARRRLCAAALAPRPALAACQRAPYSGSSSSSGSPPAKQRWLVVPEKYALRLQSLLRPLLPRYQGPAIGKAVYGVCSACPDYSEFWINECRLPETFQTWFSTTSFYVWLAMVRLRADPHAKHYNQGLVDAFFQDAERRIRGTGIRSGRIVNDTLKDLASSFKGTVMSLDEGFARSDAALAAAVWRNLLPVDDAVLQTDAIVQYARAQLQALAALDAAQITTGSFSFGKIRPD